MLYKNGETYKMTPADFKEIKAMYPKFPIRLVYPENRVRPSRLKHNILPDKPNSISFPYVATVKTKTGVESWRYAENRIIGTNGREIWTPHNLILRGTMVLQETDIEIVYWLVHCCPFLEGGKNWNGKPAKCAIEDLVGQAERKAMREEELATVKALIYSSKVGLGEKKLRLVAKAYFINGVDELSYAQVKLAVEDAIARNKRTGIQTFLDLIDAEQALEVRANLQQAIDREIITFMPQKKTWAWVTERGRKNEPIATISGGANPSEALYDYYMGNRKFAQEIVASLKGEKVLAAAGADDLDDYQDPDE